VPITIQEKEEPFEKICLRRITMPFTFPCRPVKPLLKTLPDKKCGKMSSMPKHYARLALTLMVAAAVAVPAQADSPGRGLTAQFEKGYLVFIIDHHYSALRMTELAAGTDPQRDAPVANPQEGTAPTPNMAATPAKASSDAIKSMARNANRTQREEIVSAQRFLHDWYGMSHEPQLLPEGQKGIQLLEQTAAGSKFDQTFLEVFSNHHYRALGPTLDCEVKSDLMHDQLHRYCENIDVTQKNQINDMRQMLCNQFSICDFQPGGLQGRHS
jgi:uncharacterized protein (DUF305 family)